MDENTPPAIPPEQVEEIKAHILRGEKITAIKIYRECTKQGLAESKTAVEQIESAMREATPEKFTRKSASGCGTQVALFSVLAAIVCVFLFAALSSALDAHSTTNPLIKF